MTDLIAILQAELQNWETGWSVGSFGAIGEFHQDENETLLVDDVKALTRATSRGAVRISPSDEMIAIAYELLSPKPHRWSQGLALCLPESRAYRARRTVLEELGPDSDAIRPDDRDDILFDLGLEQPQIDFCVRTRDPDLLRTLRRCCGKATFACEAGAAILAAHPHRVVMSNLGRTEVYQKIGGPETGGVSPPGPHTHVLPKLLAAKRTHSANTPIPDGLVPCAFAHPANPVIGPLGEDKIFNFEQFETFQLYIDDFGVPEYVDAKRAVWRAIEDGTNPANAVEPTTRLARTGQRNALRQAVRLADAFGDHAKLQRVSEWRARFDKADGDDAAE